MSVYFRNKFKMKCKLCKIVFSTNAHLRRKVFSVSVLRRSNIEYWRRVFIKLDKSQNAAPIYIRNICYSCNRILSVINSTFETI